MLDLDWKLAGSAAVGIITFVVFSWLATRRMSERRSRDARERDLERLRLDGS